jgi:hypothetical protein
MNATTKQDFRGGKICILENEDLGGGSWYEVSVVDSCGTKSLDVVLSHREALQVFRAFEMALGPEVVK